MQIHQHSAKNKKAQELLYCGSFYYLTDYEELLSHKNPMKTGKKFNIYSHLMSANLHKDLNQIVGTQSSSIEGKYKRARLYIFETKNMLFASICETGDRGSSWYYADKKQTQKMFNQNATADGFFGHLFEQFTENQKDEVSQFFKALLLSVYQHNAEYYQENKNNKDWFDKIYQELPTYSGLIPISSMEGLNKKKMKV